MMQRLLLITLVLVPVALSAACANRQGSFEGEQTRSGKLARGGEVLVEGAKTSKTTLEVVAQGDGLTATLLGCRLKLVKEGTAYVQVAKGQRCSMSFGAHGVELAVTGKGGVNRNGQIFSLQLKATPVDAKLSGELELRFTGRRK